MYYALVDSNYYFVNCTCRTQNFIITYDAQGHKKVNIWYIKHELYNKINLFLNIFCLTIK